MTTQHSGHIFLGVDPGVAGAAVTVGTIGGSVAPFDKCQIEVRFSKLTDSDLWQQFNLLMRNCSDIGIPLTAILEKISVRPPTSASRGGVMMDQYGMCRGFLIAAGIRTIKVTPAVWTRKMGRTDPKKTPYTKKKQRNHELAQQLYPDRKVIRETCDAFLLAEYGRRFHQ